MTEKQNAEEIIDKIIELPLRKACKILLKKGIKTCMSSANKNNLLQPGEKSSEYNELRTISPLRYPRPTFEHAGRGYAWIMIDFETLSDENKDFLFELQKRKADNKQSVGQNAILFVEPSYQIGRLTYGMLGGSLEDEDMPVPEGIKIDNRLIEFEKSVVFLEYNSGLYPEESVFLRMPINKETTVESVEEYFEVFSRSFKDQNIKKQQDFPDEPDGR